MVLNAAVQALRQAEELKQKVLQSKHGVTLIEDRGLWVTQQQLQKVYQKVLVLDLDYALDKKVEQDLWNIGFKQQIEALQAVSKDRKNPRRSEAQSMLSWILQAAAGFYLCLLHEVCSAYQLDLPFRRRASLLGASEAWRGGCGEAAGARYLCQHCLVHLGDLARYRHQPRLAHSFYKQALSVSRSSGQPYNQLALVAASRGERLAALYYHVRAASVRAPFPPALPNLARTLAAADSRLAAEEALPVLTGVGSTRISTDKPPVRWSTHSYIAQLIRLHHLLRIAERLDTAAQLVSSLNSALTALIATNSFDSMTLVKMCCINMYGVHSATEGLQLERSELGADEARAAALALELLAGSLAAYLMPAYGSPPLTYAPLPALKVLLEWLCSEARPLLREPSFVSRPQLWPALATLLNHLQTLVGEFDAQLYDTLPLPEDEELQGFMPLESTLSALRGTWRGAPQPETLQRLRATRLTQLGVRLAQCLRDNGVEYITVSEENSVTVFTPVELSSESNPELMRAIEELNLIRGQSENEEKQPSVEEEKAPDAEPAAPKAEQSVEGREVSSESEEEENEGEEGTAQKSTLPPPIIISEADFREKVREKRAGILKPQGSLERAREERALAAAPVATPPASIVEAQEPETASEPVSEEASGRGENEKRSRTNVAMQAIMRKQEESGKQVKFITPATTPDSVVDSSEISPTKEPGITKLLQPKAIKSLTNLPIGRKTGGILSLKDKSGYPHLVNADPPEPPKPVAKPEEVKKVNPSENVTKPIFGNTNQVNNNNNNTFTPNTSQVVHQKPDFQPQRNLNEYPTWSDNTTHMFGNNRGPNFHQPDVHRMGYPNLKMPFVQQQSPNSASYPQNNYLQNQTNHNIHLPVVNPKEIDVRTAALQKQHSRQEYGNFNQDTGNKSWQLSNDKKMFLNDLPPRFANQFRNWQHGAPQRDLQYGNTNKDGVDKFREADYGNLNSDPNSLFANGSGVQMNLNRSRWDAGNNMGSESIQQPGYGSWWKPGANFDPNYPAGGSLNMQAPNYFPQQMGNNISTPYGANPYVQPSNTGFQNEPMMPHQMNTMGPNYLPNTQTQMPNLQNLMSSPSFNASLNNFSSVYNNQNVSYDASMYPQFSSGKVGYQSQGMKPGGEPVDGMGLEGGGANEMMGRKGLSLSDFTTGLAKPAGSGNQAKGLDQGVGGAYSLFSGGQEAATWSNAGPQQPVSHQQSLWSGPGPSPLERLLEQQKQMKHGSNEPQ